MRRQCTPCVTAAARYSPRSVALGQRCRTLATLKTQLNNRPSVSLFPEQSGVLRQMERVEAKAQHVGAGGKHTRPSTDPEFRTRGRTAAAGAQARAGALSCGARAQRLRGAPPRQAQGGGAVARVRQDRRHHHYESAFKATRPQTERQQNAACRCAPTAGHSGTARRWSTCAGFACCGGRCTANWP